MTFNLGEDESGYNETFSGGQSTSESSTSDVDHALGRSVDEYGLFATVIGYILMFVGMAYGWYWFVISSDMFIIFRIFVGLLVGAFFGMVLFIISVMLLGNRK